MNTEHDRVHRSGFRIGLLLLAATALGGGFWALFLPRLFYDDFPLPGRDWVSTLGPYNEHPVRDYGATNLALGVLLLFVAVLLERRLVQAALVVWLVYAVPHFVFHLAQIHHFSLGDNLAQLGSLGFVVLLPLVLLALAAARDAPAFQGSRGSAASGTSMHEAARKSVRGPGDEEGSAL